MNIFDDWCRKYNIPMVARLDLISMVTRGQYVPPNTKTHNETSVQNAVRKEACHKKCVLYRNNVGAYKTPYGGFVRYGIANDNAELNENFKSSDLIGIRPVLVTQEMVGTIIGQSLGRECKKHGWVYKGNKKEKAQLNFIIHMLSLGGDYCFANSEGTI